VIVNAYEKDLFLKIAEVDFSTIIMSCAGVLVTDGEA
jgi:hypothetical protein